MLVLSRKTHETILVGEGESAIIITVTRIHGNRVHLGIDAPRGLAIRRGELEPHAPVQLTPDSAHAGREET